jgi:MSHA type pilus biogenesis protein MshL
MKKQVRRDAGVNQRDCEEHMHYRIIEAKKKNLVHIAMVFGFLLWGCATPEPRPVTLEELQQIQPKELLQAETSLKPPGRPPFNEKMEPIAKGLAEDPRLYSLLFENAPLGAILNAIMADTDYNLSVESGVHLAKPVTVRIKNATLREALDMVIVKGSGYAWKIRDGSLDITRFEEKIYHLDYLDIAGQTDIDIGGDMLATSVEGAGVAGKFQVKAQRSAERNDIWTGVEEGLNALKSPEGVLRINRNAGIVYLADTPTRIETMVTFLDSLKESLHRQVFIEAKIMEVKLNETNKYGIDWTNLQILFESNWGALPDIFDLTLNGGSTIALADQTAFRAVIDFLNTQGEVSVLSNPHLTVMNGQSAVFTVGFQFPFGDISGVDQNLDTDVVTFRSSIRRVILGLQLGLTPQISKDGIISLLIVPTITRIKEEVPVDIPLTTTRSQTIMNPVIDLQELATTVRVRDGQTVVLAGLISQIKNLNQEGLPRLNKLPLVKYLFGRFRESYEHSELVIVLTPYVKNVSG